MKNASPPVKRAILAGAAALASLLVLAAPVLAQASFSGGGRAVRVGWWDLTGVNDRDENGNPRGYDYEYLEAIAQYTGWKYTFVPVSLSEGLKMIESGELDVMGCISYNPERAGRMDYSEQPAGTGGNRLLCRMGDDRFSYGDLSAIDGKTVGSLAGSAWTERMRQYCASYHFSVRFVEADSEEVLLRELDDKSLDLVLWSQARSAGEYRSVLDFDQRPFYFVVSKSSPEVLEQMNLAMAQIKAGQPNYDAELRSKYFEVYTRLSPSFTKEEQAYIASHKEVTVAYDPAWYPIEYTDAATGTLGGIMKEIYALISERTGITFRFLTSDSFSGVYRNYGGKTQLNSILCYDFNWAQTWNVRLTPPVFDVQLECIYAEKAGKAVALPKDYYVAHYVQEHYSGENFSYQYYATVPECMDAVRTGKADMTFINSLELSYYLSMPKYGRLHFQSAPGVTLRYAVGVSGEADPLLFSILGKALGNISEAEISQIITANTVTRPTGSLTELIYTNPLLILSVVVAFLLFAGAAAYLCVRSRFVMRESRKLEAVNEQLSRANAAKGEFLSRMSHDIRTPMNGIIGMTHIAKNDPSRTRDCLEKIDVSSQYLLELINDILDMSKIDSGDMTLHPEPYTEADFRQYLNSVIFPLCEAKRQTVRLSVRSVPDRVVLVDRLRANQVLFNLLSNAGRRGHYLQRGGKAAGRAGGNYPDRRGQRLRDERGISKSHVPPVYSGGSRPHQRERGKRLRLGAVHRQADRGPGGRDHCGPQHGGGRQHVPDPGLRGYGGCRNPDGESGRLRRPRRRGGTLRKARPCLRGQRHQSGDHPHHPGEQGRPCGYRGERTGGEAVV